MSEGQRPDSDPPKHWAAVRAVRRGHLTDEQRFALTELVRIIGIFAHEDVRPTGAEAALWKTVQTRYRAFEDSLGGPSND